VDDAGQPLEDGLHAPEAAAPEGGELMLRGGFGFGVDGHGGEKGQAKGQQTEKFHGRGSRLASFYSEATSQGSLPRITRINAGWIDPRLSAISAETPPLVFSQQ
jgi:hypothetical protein